MREAFFKHRKTHMREALFQKHRIYRQLCARYNCPLSSASWTLRPLACWPLSNTTSRRSRTAVSFRERCACIARRPIQEGHNNCEANLSTQLPLAEGELLECLWLWTRSQSALRKHVKTICAKQITQNKLSKSV